MAYRVNLDYRGSIQVKLAMRDARRDISSRLATALESVPDEHRLLVVEEYNDSDREDQVVYVDGDEATEGLVRRYDMSCRMRNTRIFYVKAKLVAQDSE